MARLEHLLHEALTETTLAQLLISSYPKPISMLHFQDINCNTIELLESCYD